MKKRILIIALTMSITSISLFTTSKYKYEKLGTNSGFKHTVIRM